MGHEEKHGNVQGLVHEAKCKGEELVLKLRRNIKTNFNRAHFQRKKFTLALEAWN